VGFKNLLNISLLAASLIWFDDVLHRLEADARKDFSPYIVVWFFDTVKSEYDSDHSILTGIYFWLRSLRYSSAVSLCTLNV